MTKRDYTRAGTSDPIMNCDFKANDDTLVMSDIRPLIHDIRGVQVMLDRDLAAAYQVSTAAFNQAVKRNANRFPETFRFQLTKEEHDVLISQIVTSKRESGEETRGVKIELITHSNGGLAEYDFEAFAKQCGHFTKTLCGICHDRFIVVDRKEIFVIGASLKDAGRLTFSATKMGPETIRGLLDSLHKAAFETKNYI